MYLPYNFIIDLVMNRDPKNDNKKCGLHPDKRSFKLEDEMAKETECLDKCLKDPTCISMSAVWGVWCIGCKMILRSSRHGAEAFIKGK